MGAVEGASHCISNSPRDPDRCMSITLLCRMPGPPPWSSCSWPSHRSPSCASSSRRRSCPGDQGCQAPCSCQPGDCCGVPGELQNSAEVHAIALLLVEMSSTSRQRVSQGPAALLHAGMGCPASARCCAAPSNPPACALRPACSSSARRAHRRYATWKLRRGWVATMWKWLWRGRTRLQVRVLCRCRSACECSALTGRATILSPNT